MKRHFGFRSIFVLVLLAALVVFPISSQAKIGRYYKFNTNRVRIHAGANKYSRIIARGNKGVTVKHIATVRGWWKIRANNGKVGFVDKKFLTGGSGVSLRKNGIYTIKAKVTVRDEASSRGAKVAMFSKGTKVKALMLVGGWLRVTNSKKVTGWIPTKYIG